MDRHRAICAAWFFIVALPCCLHGNAAEPEKKASVDKAEAKISTSESLLDQLLSHRGDRAEFERLSVRAREAGINDQVRLEARFLYCVDQDQASLPQLIPQFEAIGANFSIDNSKIFATREDFLAVIEYCRAIAALEKHDDQAFKQHICEAFWLSPAQAGAYAPCIEKWRLARHIAATTIDTKQRLEGLFEPNTLSLANVLENSPALLLHFWSPWNEEEKSHALLSKIAQIAQEYQVFAASVLSDASTENIAEAKSQLNNQPKIAHLQQWVERQDHKIATSLRVTDLPTLVLLSPQGKVLYHGGLDPEALKKSLQTLKIKKTEPSSESADASSKP